MNSQLSLADWTVVGAYIAAVVGGGILLSRRQSSSLGDYFRGGNQMAPWLVMFSVIATTQSAATFLGGPDYGYRGDYSYVGSFLGSAMAAVFVAKYLIARFYALGVTTVYELLEMRFGHQAKQAAAGMYLVGRIFANGARLYMAAIAVSMMVFFNIEPASVTAAIILICLFSVGITLVGGIKSVIWSDFGQFIVYFVAALAALASLYIQIDLSPIELIGALRDAPNGQNKLILYDFRFNVSNAFSFWAIITGVCLLSIGNFGLDQDTTQRLLTCRNAQSAGRALILSSFFAIPIVFVFVTIGQLLHIFYDRPNVFAGGNAAREFSGETITVFMSYILTQMPSGVRGLATAGVVAAAISTMTSGLNAMSSVMISDFYRPWRRQQHKVSDEAYYVRAGQWAMLIFAMALGGMGVLCFYWQRYTDMPLLEFALSVMSFAYAGLIGVFFTALFTKRGSTQTVIAALLAGFFAILVQQSYVVDLLRLPTAMRSVAFPWQLIVGTAVAACVCLMGKKQERV
ncbi:MAG: sodium:solute symporter [Pseudomonadota bacterium]